jgi:hypothetical protein
MLYLFSERERERGGGYIKYFPSFTRRYFVTNYKILINKCYEITGFDTNFFYLGGPQTKKFGGPSHIVVDLLYNVNFVFNSYWIES